MIDSGYWPLVTAERMRALDHYTIEKLGVPGEVLMESAGRAVLDTLLERYGSLLRGASPGEVCVVCGRGNNGGDGLVIARHLALLGQRVRVALLSDPEKLSTDAATNYARALAAGVHIEGSEWRPPERGVIVDAIFGTGLAREVGGTWADSIARINDRAGDAVRVVSVDLPSGLDTDTGCILGCAVAADTTVTISLPKLALAQEPGRSCAGDVVVARVGIADELPGEPLGEGARAAGLWSRHAAAQHQPVRPRAGHKGTFGHVLVVAGAEGRTGAAALAARGAIRGGAGLVTVACARSLNDILEVKCTEAMTVPVAECEDRSLSDEALSEVLALAAARNVVAMGPGVGRGAATERLMRGLVRDLEIPIVLDADGLNAFEGEPSLLRSHVGPAVLTPHPAEAARLLGVGTGRIGSDRVAAARELAALADCVVLLKGAGTVVAEPGGRVLINASGGPALAAGGTGDVLTGLVAANLAQGLEPQEAAAAAAYLHGAAADRLAQQHGASGLLAGDLADELPHAAEALRREARGLDGRDRLGEDGGVSEPRQRSTLLPFP